MKEYPNIIPKIEDWPITMFYSDRQRIVKKLAKETFEDLKENPELLSMLTQTIYAEKLRSKSNPLKVDPPKEHAYWKKIESDLGVSRGDTSGNSEVHFELVQKIINRYSEEIVGNFNPKTFKFARKALTKFFKALYNPFKKKGQGFFWGNQDTLLDQFKVVGPLDDIRGLFDKGTVMIMPTHFSNLDSILIGYVIEMLTGMPAFSYGAGLNLYDYELMAYYMSRLGAYKIDRRKKNPLYRATLDAFSTVSIQEGLNSIFFPGGTRSRNGALEENLKWGLMNTIIDAQNEFYLRNFDRKIIIVPMVVSYHFVLEARGLIDQYLQRTGKENYLTVAQKKKVNMKNLRMMRRLFKSGSEVTLSFGQPIDIFGNQIDEDGRSIKNGKPVDIRNYFKSNDKLNHDHQRNRVYSRYLAEKIVKSFKKENVVLSSHVVAFTAFCIIEKMYPNLDLFGVLSLPRDYHHISAEVFYQQVGVVQKRLQELTEKDQVKLSTEVREMSAEELVKDGVKHLNAYHLYAPITKNKEFFVSEDIKLLYYYHNRLYGYKLDRVIEVDKAQNLAVRKTLY